MVCDRVAKLVLGDAGLEFRRRLWEKENEGKEKVEGGQVNEHEKVCVGIRM